MELPTWRTFPLKKWREENGFTTPEWKAYVNALNIQDAIITSGLILISAIAGYLLGKFT